MVRAAFLHDLSVVLGPRRMTLAESAASGRIRSRPDALANAGYREHRLALDGQGAADLAIEALAPLVAGPVEPGAILFASTLAPDLSLAAPSPRVRARLDLSGPRLLARAGTRRAFIAGIGQQACTSAIGALRVARGLVAAEPELAPVLVVAADRLPADALLEEGFCALSDGAAACAVSAEPRGFRLVAFGATVHGAMADASDDEAMGRLFPVAHALVMETLARAGRTPRDIAYLVPPNLPAPAARVIARTLGVPEDRAASPSLAEAGHVMACDPLLNLAGLQRAGAFSAGDLIVLLSAGLGLTWQAAVLERMAS